MKRTGPIRPRCKERACRYCKSRFMQEREGQALCSTACAIEEAQAKQAKAARKAALRVKREKAEEKKKDKARREKLRTIGDLEEDCRTIVQALARARDRNDGCISCHVGPNYGGAWHGSHYRAHGACSSLQMHLWNVHKSCAQCNLFKGGNREGYVRGLLAKPGYGRERLDWLDSQPKSQRFSRDYLARFKIVMGKRLRRIEKRLRAGE